MPSEKGSFSSVFNPLLLQGFLISPDILMHTQFTVKRINSY